MANLTELAVLVSLVSRTLRIHHWILAFHARGRCVEHLLWDLQQFGHQSEPVFVARWFLLAFSAVFLSLFLLDCGGDESGWKSTVWLPFLMWILPVIGALLADRFRGGQTQSAALLLPTYRQVTLITKPRASLPIELPGRMPDNPLQSGRRESGGGAGTLRLSLARHSLHDPGHEETVTARTSIGRASIGASNRTSSPSRPGSLRLSLAANLQAKL
jgi:hypothetical protein